MRGSTGEVANLVVVCIVNDMTVEQIASNALHKVTFKY